MADLFYAFEHGWPLAGNVCQRKCGSILVAQGENVEA